MSDSIFRRGGQKTEAHGTPGEQQISYTDLETKLAGLQKSWAAPLIASTQSFAVWQPENNGAEVTIERGNVLQRMGYRRHRKLYLHVEEAVYLVSRGSLLLSMIDAAGQHRLLTLHEATECMVFAGVSIAQYQVYCHLVRAGYIVTRYPAIWVLNDAQHPHQIWGDGQTSALQMMSSHEHAAALPAGQPEEQSHVSGWLDLESSSLLPPRKRLKASVPVAELTEEIASMYWWPPALPSSIWNPRIPEDLQVEIPRCLVIEHEADDSATSSLLTLRPFPAMPHAHSADAARIPDDLKLAYEVLKPNKRFSKGNPDPSKFVICLASGVNLPACNVVRSLQETAAPLPLQFARVSGGEVSFHNLVDMS